MVLFHNFGIELMNCSNRHLVFSGFVTVCFLHPYTFCPEVVMFEEARVKKNLLTWTAELTSGIKENSKI